MKNGVATKEKKKYVGKLPYKAFIDPKNPTIETIEIMLQRMALHWKM